MKKVLKSVSICFIIAAMLTAGAFAAVPGGLNKPQASKYISDTTTGILALGGGKIEVGFDITATQPFKDVGALQVDIFEVGNDDPVKTYYYTHSDSKDLMAHNTGSHLGSVTYNGQTGHRYYGYVSFFAGEHGVKGDIYNMTTVIVTA